jgi:hypothetical protein
MRVIHSILAAIALLLNPDDLLAIRYRAQPDTTAYTILDSRVVEPEFTYKKGKTRREKLNEFYKDNLRYPQEEDCTGKVYLSFVVEPDGRLSSISIVRGIAGCGCFNAEALRVVKLMEGCWKPATRDGRTVRYRTSVAVWFHDLE